MGSSATRPSPRWAAVLCVRYTVVRMTAEICGGWGHLELDGQVNEGGYRAAKTSVMIRFRVGSGSQDSRLRLGLVMLFGSVSTSQPG
jgi:hypothetical protein